MALKRTVSQVSNCQLYVRPWGSEEQESIGNVISEVQNIIHNLHTCCRHSVPESMSIQNAKILHAQATCLGCDLNPDIGNPIIRIYGSATCIRDAQFVFDRMQNPDLQSRRNVIQAYLHNGNTEMAKRMVTMAPFEPDVVLWTSIMSSLYRCGKPGEALEFFYKMQVEGAIVNRVSLVCALDICTAILAFDEGVEVHTAIVSSGMDHELKVATSVIHFYGAYGRIHDAMDIFNRISSSDAALWNVFFGALTKNDLAGNSLQMFHRMHLECFLPNKISYVNILDACASVDNLEMGIRVHSCIVATEYQLQITVQNCIINMYGKCKTPQNASLLFGSMPSWDSISFNTMIGMMVYNYLDREALDMFFYMQYKHIRHDRVACLGALNACANLSSLLDGYALHFQIVDSGLEEDVSVGSALINLYGCCGSLTDVQWIFSRMVKRDVALWTAAIAAFLCNGKSDEALNTFLNMQLNEINPDKIAYARGLDACGNLIRLEDGKKFHNEVVIRGYDHDAKVASSVISTYAKCGELLSAKTILSTSSCPSSLLWSALIPVFSKRGYQEEALDLYIKMLSLGCSPDSIIFSCVLEICTDLAMLEAGMKIHCSIIDAGYDNDLVLSNGLIKFYGSCGSLQDAKSISGVFCCASVVSWTTIMSVLAQNAHEDQALMLFNKLQNEGVKPDPVSLACALTACSWSGQIIVGKYLFVMSECFAITLTEDHFLCMVDLLGRAGLLDEADQLIKNVPFEPSVKLWTSFLNACKLYGETDRAINIANHCFCLYPGCLGPYITLSNIFSGLGLDEE